MAVFGTKFFLPRFRQAIGTARKVRRLAGRQFIDHLDEAQRRVLDRDVPEDFGPDVPPHDPVLDYAVFGLEELNALGIRPVPQIADLDVFLHRQPVGLRDVRQNRRFLVGEVHIVRVFV